MPKDDAVLTATVYAMFLSFLTVFRRFHITESVCQVVLQKSIPAQIRQLILDDSDDTGYVDEFAGESAFAK